MRSFTSTKNASRATFGALLGVGLTFATSVVVAHDAEKPNILVIWCDDIGQSNISA